MEQPNMNASTLSARISALMDDERPADGNAIGGSAADAAIRELCDEASAREIWLQYHQIGDLLRSAELSPLSNERDFLQRFSERLGREAIQIAPAVAVAAQPTQVRHKYWSATGAVAASFAVIALVSLAIGPLRHASQSAPFFAQMQAVPGGHRDLQRIATYVPTTQPRQIPVVATIGGQVPGVWGQYLMAHQQLAGSVLPYTPPDIHEADLRVAVSH